MNIFNKRILITQPILHNFCGSTVVTIELADYFKKKGAKVDVYSYTLDEPVKWELEKRRISMYTAHNAVNLDIFNYDYIWIHSQVLPESMTSQLSELHNKKERPYFIFLHMSPHDYIPDEFQWIYDFEDKLADLVLYISEETQRSHEKLFSNNIEYTYFRNPCPESYFAKTPPKQLKKILVVSNHAPKEIDDALSLLEKRGITVNHLGANGNKQGLINPKDIKGHDAIITIGKTVQYCILAKRPVYIYDIFGGSGYLNSKNYKKNQIYNFSGRGYNKKEAKEIADEIVNQWGDAKRSIQKIHKKHASEYALNNVIPNTLSIIKKRNIDLISPAQQKSIYYAQRLAQYRFQELHSSYLKDKTIKQLQKDIFNREQREEHLKQLYAPNFFIRLGRKINYIKIQRRAKYR